MAWESRSGRRYYYRSIRVQGRVTKAYVGAGQMAELAAAEDAEARAERRTDAEAWHQELACIETLEAQMATIWQQTTLLLKAVLYGHGYTQHARGPWRKRRRRARPAGRASRPC